MTRNSWDDYFFSMVDLVASKSKDVSTKVGAVVVGPDNEIRSTGFNGFPRGVNDKNTNGEIYKRYNERPYKYFWAEHAERNAIYNAARIGVSLKNCVIYQSLMPCSDCTRAIIQSGICKIKIDKEKENEEFNQRWKEHIEISKTMLFEAGVELFII